MKPSRLGGEGREGKDDDDNNANANANKDTMIIAEVFYSKPLSWEPYGTEETVMVDFRLLLVFVSAPVCARICLYLNLFQKTPPLE